MSNLTGESRARYVRGMFARIAGHYDLLNRVMTFGQDRRWRRDAIARLHLKPGGRLLDIGAGTGDLCFEAQRQQPGSFSVAADFTAEMISVGRDRSEREPVAWVIADALHLPFREGVFDGTVSGFLMRNVADVDMALQEQYRVLKPAGRFVCLETSPPEHNFLFPLISLYLNRIIPAFGRLLAGDPEAYRYLPSSTQDFLSTQALATRMHSAGYRCVEIMSRMFGTIAIHCASKPTPKTRMD